MNYAKKPKLEELDYFTPINEDCINQILNWLNLDDLCAISRTCKKLRNLAIQEFQRKYPEKTIFICERIVHNYMITVYLRPNENYVKCFSRYVRNVFVDLSDRKLVVDLAVFMQSHISQFPKKIQFLRGHCYINKSFAEGIRSILENVEYVEFSSCYGNKNDYYNEILNKCKRLKCLEINPSYYPGIIYKFQINAHPNLEFFQCNFKDKQMTDNLSDLLKHNSTIKRIAFTFGEHLSDVDIKRCIEAVAEKSNHFDNVFFTIERSEFNLALIENKLKCLADSKHITRFELNLKQNHVIVQNVATLAGFSGLHSSAKLSEYIINSNAPFTKLRFLSFNTSLELILSKQIATVLSHKLPNLEFLLFRKIGFVEQEKLTDAITPFIRYSKKLGEMCFYGYSTDYHYNESVSKVLNEERKKLEGACELIIKFDAYFAFEHMMISKKSISNKAKLLVQLKPSYMEHHYAMSFFKKSFLNPKFCT